MFKKLSLFIVAFFLFILLSNTNAVFATVKRTSVLWIASSKNGVNVTPYIGPGKTSITFDFDRFNNNMLYVYYDLNYGQQDGQRQRVIGSFIPSSKLYNGWYNGKPFYRITIPFGTCSQGVCTLHRIKDLTLQVNTKMKNGIQYGNLISIPNDQF